MILCGQSDSHNLKYMGIDALGRLIKLSPEIAEKHQLAVIDCLEVRMFILDALRVETNVFCIANGYWAFISFYGDLIIRRVFFFSCMLYMVKKLFKISKQ